MLRYKYDDAGRSANGFTHRDDCGPRCISLVTKEPYDETLLALSLIQGKSAGKGTQFDVARQCLLGRGFVSYRVMRRLALKTIHEYMIGALAFPMATYAAFVHKHFVAVVDNVAIDTFDSRRKRVFEILVHPETHDFLRNETLHRAYLGLFQSHGRLQ